MFFIFCFNTFLFNLEKHVNYCEKISFSLLYLTLVMSCIIGPFLCCHLLYLIIYLVKTKIHILYIYFLFNFIFINIHFFLSNMLNNCKLPLPSPLDFFKVKMLFWTFQIHSMSFCNKQWVCNCEPSFLKGLWTVF